LLEHPFAEKFSEKGVAVGCRLDRPLSGKTALVGNESRFCRSKKPRDQSFTEEFSDIGWFLFRIHYMDYPDCLLLFLSISVFYFFSFSVFTLLVVAFVRQIKLTHVGFRAHVKIASRIVSYRTRYLVISLSRWLGASSPR